MLVMFAISMVVIIACSGLAIDIGRMYVTRTEAQSFVDALALAKAAEYIGAREENADDVWKRYNFNNESFTNYEVGYASSPGGTYSTTVPAAGSGNLYVRATTTVDVPLLLLRVLVPDDVGTVTATAVAGLEQVTSMAEGGFPTGVREVSGGFQVGTPYTIRWDQSASANLQTVWSCIGNERALSIPDKIAATAKFLSGENPFPGEDCSAAVKPTKTTDKILADIYPPWCAGNATPPFLQSLYDADPSKFEDADSLFAWDGLYFKYGTSFIKEALAFGYQEQLLSVDGYITYAPGKEGEPIPSSLWDVVNADSDQSTQIGKNPSDYNYDRADNYRLIIVPVVESSTVTGAQNGSAKIVSFQPFILLVEDDYPWDEYDKKGNWCATYYGGIVIGPEVPSNQNGVWQLRLIS